jgi:serine/threonine protein kinase
MTNFKIIKSLNKGAFAHVYEVLEVSSGKTLALKIVRLNLLILILYFSKKWILCSRVKSEL